MLDEFYVASQLKATSDEPEFYTEKVEKFSNTDGNEVQIDRPLVKTALKHLGAIWGEAIKFSELLDIAKSELQQNGVDLNWDNQLKIAREIFMQFVDHSTLIEIHTQKESVTTKVGEKPKLNPLARWQFNEGTLILARYSRAVSIQDPIVGNALKQMDGSITLDEVKENMREGVKADETIEEKDQYFKNISKTFSAYLERLERAGMFDS